MFPTHRQVFYVGALTLLIALILHDRNLYSHLSISQGLILSGLRYALLAIPFLLGWKLSSKKKHVIWLRVSLWIGWLLSVPYTIYSMFEVRHVAELCRLSTDTFFTQQCVEDTWMLIPTFIYALAGTMIFVFTLSQVSASIIKNSAKKRAFITAISAYVSTASVFGLYTRINVWEFFTAPTRSLEAVFQVLQRTDFYLNSAIIFIFTIILFLVLNRVFYRAERYIFD